MESLLSFIILFVVHVYMLYLFPNCGLRFMDEILGGEFETVIGLDNIGLLDFLLSKGVML